MKNLVAYFSAEGTTKRVAEKLKNVLKADIYEITPAKPYTREDLNYMDRHSRTTLEKDDENARPEIVKKPLDTAKYETIFLGFPIWWYVAPKIVNTFLESYDFSNKNIILFATSGGSGFGNTVKFLKPSLNSSTKIREGKLLNGNPSEADLETWIKSLKL